MADRDASPPPHLRPQLAAREPSASYRAAVPETGLTSDNNVPDTALGIQPADFVPQGPAPSSPDGRSHAGRRHSSALHRAHKPRPSGGFLLPDTLLSRRDAQTPISERRRRPSTGQHSDSGQHGQETAPQRPRPDTVHAAGSDSGVRVDGSNSTAITKRDSLAGDTAVGSSPDASAARLDMEAAQIVNMALNLNESRRLAARKSIAQPTPPRLAPLPDNAPGGSLRYHLQQQRKMSRTVSPKPDRSPRIASGRVFTPLQPAFDPGPAYRYHFSTSTLARAQKAKEYLALMAQYRRVLELVPPLEPERSGRPWTASPPPTPNGSASVSRVSTNEHEARIGRPYNPLQYIRNRKVRARERRAIDGEALGFNDVVRVSEWVDEVAKWVATGQARTPGNPALPPFSNAEAAAAAAAEASPPPANARTAAVVKPKRPRVDWVIDPADMLADVYWLELDDNKKLVEDRHWRRVFPQGSDVQPLSRDDMPRLATPVPAKDPAEAHTPGDKTPDPPPPRHEHEHVLSAARDRAQQKFRALKGSHHRRASSTAHRDLLRLSRGSLSESSDTDSDRRRRGAKGAPGAPIRSVLERQMEELIAQEQREAESHPLYDRDAHRMQHVPAAPAPELLAPRSAGSRRRADSRAELSEAESALGPKALPLPRSLSYTAGQASLEVPGSRRPSVDNDTSQACSPDLQPSRDGGLVPPVEVGLSPMSSRPGSPHRNPLTKVKSIFRDRSKERSAEPNAGDDGALTPSASPAPDSWMATPETSGSGMSSPQRRPSRSPAGERVLGHRSHKSLSGARMRGDDGNISFRSLLRGPRIDTVLRSGVSKVSDMLWRKEGGDDSTTSPDDSDAEPRGRPRGLGHGRSVSLHDVKHLRDARPAAQLQHPPSRPLSRRSSRFELLKPPRIDVQHASPSRSPPPVLVRPHDPAASDTESHAARGDARAHGSDGAHPPLDRTWTIADHRGTPPARSPAASRRDMARLRALLLSSGIHAMEMDRRATERRLLPSPTLRAAAAPAAAPAQPRPLHLPHPLTWHDIAALAPDRATQERLLTTPLAQTDMYPAAARALAASASASASRLDALSARLASDTAAALAARVDALRARVVGELGARAQAAADAADEANQDLVAGQRLKVKRVVDAMDKMLRRRRRRFRWARRAGWLVVEWLLVGCMWYVWFVVMLARVVLGVGKGVVRGVRWLLWL